MAALKRGADAALGTIPTDLEVAFPYFGETLERFTRSANLPLASEITARGSALGDEFLAFQAEVAEAAGVSVPTLKRAEAGGRIKVADETIAVIAKALERAGVEFIPENGGGAGVRLAKRGKRAK